MVNIKIHYSKRYIKDFKKLTPSLRLLAAEREKIFKNDPHLHKLKTHKLTGKLQDYWSFSLNYQDRVLFRFINQSEVIFYKIGSHDVYK